MDHLRMREMTDIASGESGKIAGFSDDPLAHEPSSYRVVPRSRYWEKVAFSCCPKAWGVRTADTG
jgi:hypothetical protein